MASLLQTGCIATPPTGRLQSDRLELRQEPNPWGCCSKTCIPCKSTVSGNHNFVENQVLLYPFTSLLAEVGGFSLDSPSSPSQMDFFIRHWSIKILECCDIERWVLYLVIFLNSWQNDTLVRCIYLGRQTKTGDFEISTPSSGTYLLATTRPEQRKYLNLSFKLSVII